MRYCNTLLAVKDMKKSLEFYKTLFGQEVTVDLGWCKSLSCGLALQEHFDEIAGVPPETMKLSVCGTDCSVCGCYGEMCQGCHACSGKVFHAPEGKACAIYDCTVNHKGLGSCGECSDAPCDIWMRTRDPRYSDEEFEENVKMRMQALKFK